MVPFKRELASSYRPVMVLWDVLCNGNVGLVGLSNVNVQDGHTTSTAVGGRCPEID